MSDQRDAANTRATLVVLRTVTAVLAVCALIVGFLLSVSGPDSTASNVLLGAGVALGVVGVALAGATGAFKRMSVGTAIVLVIGLALVGAVLVDLTNG